MNHGQIQELLGAYALDAVEPDEAAVVEAHLETCPPCREEVGAHREVAALIGSQGAEAPPELWERILAAIGESEEEPAPLLPFIQRPPAPSGATPPRWRSPLAVAAVVAMLIGIGSLLTIVARQQHQIGQLQAEKATPPTSAADLSSLALKAATQPNAKRIPLASSSQVVATAIVLPDGTGYLVPDGNGLPALDDQHVYQLWAVADGAKISVGLLGSRPAVTLFHAPSSLAAMAVTAERQPGVTASANQPVAFGQLA